MHDEKSSSRRRSSLYDDEPEDSYNFFDDEKAFNSGFNDFDDIENSRSSRKEEPSRKWETALERKKREKIEALKEEQESFKLKKISDMDFGFSIFNMKSDEDKFEFTTDFEDSIRGRVERNREKAKRDAKKDDSMNISKMLFGNQVKNLFSSAIDESLRKTLKIDPFE